MPNNRRNRPDEPEGEGGAPAWMQTFGDMMTLLLTFFVLLYSMSQIDVDRFEMAMTSLRENLGAMDGGQTVSTQQLMDGGVIGDDATPISAIVLDRVMMSLDGYIEEEGLEDEVQVELTERGLVVRFTGQVLFDLGQADIRPEGEEVLQEVAVLLEEVPNDVLVEGHTDNLPISTEEFPSNWELSTRRATEVTRFFIEQEGIESARFSAAGYSEYRPIVPNDSPENREQNRRVEVVLLRPDYMGPPRDEGIDEGEVEQLEEEIFLEEEMDSPEEQDVPPDLSPEEQELEEEGVM